MAFVRAEPRRHCPFDFGIRLDPVPFLLSSEVVGAEAAGALQSWLPAANLDRNVHRAAGFPVSERKAWYESGAPHRRCIRSAVWRADGMVGARERGERC